MELVFYKKCRISLMTEKQLEMLFLRKKNWKTTENLKKKKEKYVEN